MKKYVLKATALAIGALVGGLAVADTNLDSGALSGTTGFASELNYNSGTTGGSSITVGSVVSSKLGFGVSGGQNRYIRVDLVNAKLKTGLTGGSLAMAVAPAFANVTVVQGGAVGDTSVVFQVTANAAGHAASQIVQLTLADVDVISTGSNATISYKLYETAVDAANASASTLYSKSGNLFTFSAGLAYALVTNTSTASVEKSFREFTTTGTNPGLAADLARLGYIRYTVNAVARADGTAVALSDLVTGATKVTVAGDFSAATTAAGGTSAGTGVFLSNLADCSTQAAAGTLNTAKTSADITVGTTAGGLTVSAVAGYYALCYEVTKNTAIPAQTATALLDLTAATGSAAVDTAAAAVGIIERDGTELQAPLASVYGPATNGNRVVLTSTHTADAAVEATAILENGVTCSGGTANYTLLAGKQLFINASQVCPTVSAGTRFALKLVIAAPNSKISGVYNSYTYDPTTARVTDMSSYPLLRPGTN